MLIWYTLRYQISIFLIGLSMFTSLTQKISGLFSNFGKQKKVSNQDIEKLFTGLHEALLQADVPHELVVRFCDELRQKLTGLSLHTALNAQEQVTKVMFDHVKQFLSVGAVGGNAMHALFKSKSILVLGLQGSGKTTSIAKIAYYIKKEAQKKNKKPSILLSSVDFYRPAAIDQLELLAKQVGVDFYRAQSTDSIEATREIVKHAQANKYDHWLLDTAGRLHVDSAMLNEIKEINQIMKPSYKLLVLDAMTGQESLAVARNFVQVVDFNGAALAKMDSDTRGGAAFSFSYALQKPIVFVGVGEKPANLEIFWPDRMASRILGYGDMATLAEKADEKIKQSEQQSLYKAYTKGDFSLQDFADQLSMVGRLGSMGQLMKYMPGMPQVQLSDSMIEQGEKEMKIFKAIISSMTPIERYCPRILDGSRKKRIALGAGVQVQDIKLLLSRFEQSKQYVKLLKKSGIFQRHFK